MTTMTLLWTESHANEVASLNVPRDGLFLDRDFVSQAVLPSIAATTATLFVVYGTILFLCVAPLHSSRYKARKMSYQLTNFLTNLVLAGAGLYYEFVEPLEDGGSSKTVEYTVRNHQPLVFFSCFQIGYQLWAIPIGISVKESLPMLLHHVTVVIICAMSGFMVNGFRYYTPFFYGTIEVSSLPLAVMNAFKDHPEYIKQYPTAYRYTRYLFAALFLYVRLVLFVPRQLPYLRDLWLLYSTSGIPEYQLFMTFVWLSSVFLLALQCYWSALILKGLARQWLGGGSPLATKKVE